MRADEDTVGLQFGQLIVDLPHGTFYAVGSVGGGRKSWGNELKLLLESLHIGVALLSTVKDKSPLPIEWLQSALYTSILIHLSPGVGSNGYKSAALAVLHEEGLQNLLPKGVLKGIVFGEVIDRAFVADIITEIIKPRDVTVVGLLLEVARVDVVLTLRKAHKEDRLVARLLAPRIAGRGVAIADGKGELG